MEKKNLTMIIDEKYENEQKQVIKIMQDQVQDKVKEVQVLTKQLDDITLSMGNIKLQLAKEREANEELQIQIEIFQAKLKVSCINATKIEN